MINVLINEEEKIRMADPFFDIFAAIETLKKEKNAIILAHFYQEPDIQDVADFLGDSLALAQEAQKTTADVIVFAGVNFMAETAKILNPDKKVLLPDLAAGCSLSDSCPPAEFKKFIDQRPGHIVVSYINCSAEVKALSDIICTSSNAEKIINSIPPETPIIFGPDKNLGSWLEKKTGRKMVLWDGACMVHEIFSREKIDRVKIENPEAKLIAHPECQDSVLKVADFVGSTSALLNYVQSDSSKQFIVATESGILHQMKKAAPDKVFIPAPPLNNCACNDCPHMKLNTLEKLYLCLKNERPELMLDEQLRQGAERSLLKMLEISAR